MGNKKRKSHSIANKSPDPIDERMGLLDTIKAMVEKEVRKQLGRKKDAPSLESQDLKEDSQPP